MGGIGTANLRRHRKGEFLTPRNAIIAKCCSCQRQYVDGTEDCNKEKCPLYPWMPYGHLPRAKRWATQATIDKRVAALNRNKKKRSKQSRLGDE